MVAFLIMSSSPHNKDCDHENCDQAVLTKSQRSILKSKSKSQFSQSHSRSCETLLAVVIVVIKI